MTQPLALPERWVDELARQRTASVRPVLTLSVLPGGVTLPPGCSTNDVAADLERGAWLVRNQRRPGWYRLGGDEFEVSVRVRPAEDGGHPVAVAYQVDVVESVRPSARMRPRVAFVSIFDEVGCDLAVVLRQLDQAGTARSQLQRARQPADLRRHGSLRALVSKEYGQLGTLLKLLAERAARQPDLEVAGVVLPGEQMRIELDGATDSLVRRRVTVQAGDEEYQTQVSRVVGRVLTLEPMRNWDAPAGTRVVVTAASRFAMRQNAEALDRFQREEVDGDWHDLATLLCDPKQLRMPEPVPMPPRFFCDVDPDTDPLNDPQRLAVAGALASPHAFLIQGPPGTGKTTVISELIQQLIARGERVLMLAPSHVAVDEVLGRVGPKPGVRALRITWNADKVDAKLHPYLFDRVGRDLARLVLRESAGRRARWAQRGAELDADMAALAELRDAMRAEGARTAACLAAAQELVRVRDAAEARHIDGTAQLTEAEQHVDVARREEAEAHTAADAAARELAGYDREMWPRLIMLRAAAAEAVTAADTLASARAKETDAHQVLREWTATIDRVEARLREWRGYAAQNEPQVNARLAEAAHNLATLRARLADPRSASGWLDSFGMGSLHTTRRQEARAERAWQHWAARRAQLDRSAAAAAADESELAAYLSHRQAWRVLLAERTAAREASEPAWPAAVQRLAERLADVTGTRPTTPDVSKSSVEDWRALCAEYADGLGAFLNTPAEAPRLPERKAFRPLNDVLDRYRQVLRRKAEAAAWVSTAATELARVERTAEELLERVESDRANSAAAVHAATKLVEARRAEMHAASQRRVELAANLGRAEYGGGRAVPVEEVEERLDVLSRERVRLNRYQSLRDRWERLTADRSTDELVEDVRKSFVRATNLVCATTRGIVSQGSQPVRDTDYDTLIVDEASRVTESEFLIGAVRARRWILVGDEHQLPPHVDGDDEQHLHALAAIHRLERGASPSLAAAVAHLAELWHEDEELHEFRTREVTGLAEKLLASGDWADGYRETFRSAYRHFASEDDGDAALLRAMVRHLVRSLFERAVQERMELRRPLLEQRRMVPALARIVRQPVYRGRYEDPPPAELERIGMRPITTPHFPAPVTFIDTSLYADKALDQQVGRTFTNELEQDAVLWALRTYDEDLLDAGVRAATVSVLAFYKAQAAALNRRIDRSKLKVLEPKVIDVIDVIDAIQGQQADIVLLSFTRATKGRPSSRFGRWLQDVRRLNVACTRARRALVLIGHAATLRRLNGVDEARAFYAHLFGLFTEDPEQYQLKGRFK